MDNVARLRGTLMVVGNDKCCNRGHGVPAANVRESGEC
jgi:hypothetical protein